MTDDDPVAASVAAYSSHAADYARRYEHHLLDRPERFATSLQAGARILDAGCGPGRDLRIFTEHGHRPIGVDLNPDFVEMASRVAPVHRLDLRSLVDHFPPAQFDGVWAQASLVHLGFADAQDVLRQFRVLAVPGAPLFACVAATGAPGWRDESDGRRWYAVWAPEEFAAAVERAGFEVEEIVDGPYVEVWARAGGH